MSKNVIKSNKKSRKKLKFGIEFELFILDTNGYMTNGADRLINRVKKEHPEIEIKRECGKNMIEIITFITPCLGGCLIMSKKLSNLSSGPKTYEA